MIPSKLLIYKRIMSKIGFISPKIRRDILILTEENPLKNEPAVRHHLPKRFPKLFFPLRAGVPKKAKASRKS